MNTVDNVIFRWPDTAIHIGIVILVAVVARFAVRFGIRRVVAAAAKSAEVTSRRSRRSNSVNLERVQARTKALASMLRSVATVVIAIIAIMTIFQIIGIPLSPILASAGVGGLALGFGAQSIVKDLLSGIFMIVEDQYGVGDVVDTGDVVGTVEEVTLRITKVRDYDGVIWYVRNGEILRVANKTQGWATAWVDLPVSYKADVDAALAALEAAVEVVYQKPEWAGKMIERPQVIGVQSVEQVTMTLRIMALCHPEQHFSVGRELREEAMQQLRMAGVPAPMMLPIGTDLGGGTGSTLYESDKS